MEQENICERETQLQPAPLPGPIRILAIIGQVEGHTLLAPTTKATKYEQILPILAAIEEDPTAKGLCLLLNTVGGDVEAGLAMAEMVSGMRKPSVSLVLGGGHSIGVPLAAAADRSFIAPSATMTVHPIRLSGVVIGASQTYEYLDRMSERIVDFVTAHARIPRQAFWELMHATGNLADDIGTVLVGRDAVECGLIDAVGGIGDALAYLHERIDDKSGPSPGET